MDFDAIVIGSGFGGAITACRLAEANLRVAVLERGRRWKTYPRKLGDPWLWDQRRPERYNGWLDLRRFDDMAVAQGAGVGGGSLIYANISTEAPPSSFAKGWPEPISHAELKRYYDRVAKFMKVQRVPDNQWPARTRFMREAADKVGARDRFKALELAVTFDPAWTYEQENPHDYGKAKSFVNEHGQQQGTCVHCGLCDVGCPVGAKNTLDLNYIPRAESKGADVRPLHIVRHIDPLIGGYRVEYDRLEGGRRRPGAVTAPIVILAAGSLGSTELLLRCKYGSGSLPKVSDRLGKNWSCNGDFLTPSVHPNRKVSPTLGPTITSAIDFLDGTESGQSFWVQDGGFFDLFGPLYVAKTSRFAASHVPAKLFRHAVEYIAGKRDPFTHVMPWFGQAVDAGDGVLSLERRWKLFGERDLKLKWDIDASLPALNALVDMHEKLARATDGTILVSPTWTVFKDLITPHPLGGCGMGNDARDGVVDHTGQVFGYPNLFVTDGAIIPRALGVNPSRTIGALAERAAAHICQIA